jgi:hypothetical protein
MSNQPDRPNPVAERILKDFAESPVGQAFADAGKQMLAAYVEFAKQFSAALEQARLERERQQREENPDG